MFKKLVLILLVASPFIIAVVVAGVFLQPEKGETITQEVWLPHTNAVEMDGIALTNTKSVSVEEFRQLGVENPTLLVQKVDGIGFKLEIHYLARVDGENGQTQQYLAKAKVKPKFGQTIDSYILDEQTQTITVEMGRSYWNGADLFWGLFNPVFLYGTMTMMATVTALIVWLKAKGPLGSD